MKIVNILHMENLPLDDLAEEEAGKKNRHRKRYRKLHENKCKTLFLIVKRFL